MTSQGGPSQGSKVRAGIVGLGVMGANMARNLLRRRGDDTDLHVTNLVPVPDLVEAGATWHDSARTLAAVSDVVVFMVPDLPQVEQALEGPDGLLAGVDHATVVAISSTVSPEGVRRLGASLHERTGGLVTVVDAPVSGGEEGARAGTLSIMLGGPEDAVARVMPVYRAMGTPVRLGDLGAGQVAKACNQMIVAATVAALGEAAVVAERASLDVRQLFDLLAGGYAGSRILEVKAERFAAHDHSPSGPARFLVKDLGFAIDEARRTGTPTPLTDVLRTLFTDVTAAGLGDHDTAVVQAFLESRPRTEV